MKLGKLAILAFAIAVAPASVCLAESAESWPQKSIRLIVPFANGGSTDLVARQIGIELGKRVGQPVIVENKVGAGGIIGSLYVSRQPADGYTLLMGTVSTHAIAPSVNAKLPYDIEKDFTPITLVGTIPDLIVVNPKVPANNLAEFIALAKSKPGVLTYGSGGPGTSSHLGSEYFASEAGVSFNHVPYKGSGPALVDVLGGHIDMMLDVVMTSLEPVKSDRLRALAVTSKTRTPLLPDVPTVAESGMPDFEAIIWFGILAPGNMPAALQKRIADALDAVLTEPGMKEFLLTKGIEAGGTGPQVFVQQMKSDIKKWRDVAQTAKITPQ